MTDLLDKTETVERRISAGGRGAPWLAESRALLTLAAPLVLTQLAQMAIGTTDLILLGRYSQSALAAVAIGNTVYWFAWLLGGGPASAVSPMIAHILGERAGNRGGVRASLRMGLWAVGIVSLVVMPIMWSAKPILLMLHQQPDLADGAGKFVTIVSIGLPFSLSTMVLSGFATALGHPRAGLWVSLATIVFNGLAGWTLIYGHFGAPRLGIVGSGLATAGSAVFGFLAMLAIIHRNPDLRVYRMFRRFGRPVHVKLAEVFRLGLPIGVTTLFEAMLFNAMTLLMGTYGAAALAAHQIAMNAASITFMVPLGIGMASTVRVGLAAGAGDIVAARRAGLVALGMGGLFMATSGVVMALLGAQLAGLYLGNGARDDAAVIALAAVFLRYAAAFQLFDGLQVVGARVLRGLKDARVPMILAGASYWIVGAPVCVFLAVGLNLRGEGIWIGFVICLAVAAFLMCARFLRLTRAGGARTRK
ncbi:MAG: family efflux transporter [Caulobacteraceae bacterium]|nr:family efflux transporter [Caulobacteraceae bacterium]